MAIVLDPAFQPFLPEAQPPAEDPLARALREGLESGALGASEIVQRPSRRGLTPVVESLAKVAGGIQGANQQRRRTYVEQELMRQGYTRDQAGGWIPPSATLTQADFDEGVRRINANYDLEFPDDDVSPFFDRFVTGLGTGLDEVAQRQAGFASEAGGIREQLGAELPVGQTLKDVPRGRWDPVPGTQSALGTALGGIFDGGLADVAGGVLESAPGAGPVLAASRLFGGPGGAEAVRAGYETYNRDIPYFSQFMRETGQPFLGDVGAFFAENSIGVPGVGPVLAGLEAAGLPRRTVGREVAEALAPITLGDVALELIPGIGSVPDAARLAGRGARAYARGVARGAPGIAAAADVLGLGGRLAAQGDVAARAAKPPPTGVPTALQTSNLTVKQLQTEITARGATPVKGKKANLVAQAESLRQAEAPFDPSKILDGVIPGAGGLRIPGTKVRIGGGKLLGGGETLQDAALRQYEGAVNFAAQRERNVLEEGRKLMQGLGVRPGDDTPEVRELFKALHGEGPVPAKLQPVYDRLKALLAEEEKLTTDFDPRFRLYPDYFPRFWDLPKQTSPRPRGLGGKGAFQKARVDATFDELLSLGYKPKYMDPNTMVALRRMAGEEYRAQSKLLEVLRNSGLAVDAVGPVPEGWRIPNVSGAVFQQKPYVGKEGKVAFTPAKYVKDDVATVVEQLFGKESAWNVAGVDVRKPLMTASSAAKQTKLLGSFFQQMDFAQRTATESVGAALDAIARGEPVSAVKNLVKLPVNVAKLIPANVSPQWRAALRRSMTADKPILKSRPGLTWALVSKQGLGSGDISVFNQTIEDAVTGVAGMAKGGRPRRLINSALKGMRNGLFEGVYPQAQKMSIENFWAPSLVRQYGDLSDEQLAAMIATEVNKRFSSMTKSQSALRHLNRNLVDLAHMAAFSTNETESFLKQMGSTLVGPARRQWVEEWLGTVIFLGAVAEAVHYGVTGEPLPQDRMLPLKAGGPLGLTYNNRWLAPDIAEGLGRGGTNLSIDLLMQMDTGFRLLDPSSFLKARQNVLMSAAYNQFAGKDFFGRPIDTPKERFGQLISDVALPIPGQNLTGLALKTFPALEGWIAEQEARLGPVGQGIQATGANIHAETNSQIYDRLAQQSGLMDKSGNEVRAWEDLTPAQKAEVMMRPENAELSAELIRRGEEAAATGSVFQQLELANRQDRLQAEEAARLTDQDIAAGNISGPDARERYDKIRETLAEAAAGRRELPEYQALVAKIAEGGKLTEAEQATSDYFAIFDQPGVVDPATKDLNFDAYEAALDEWEKSHPGYSKQDVSPSRPLSPGHAELIQARADLKPYFDAPDEAFALAQKLAVALPANDPRRLVLNYTSLGQMRTTIETTLRNAGVPETQIQSGVDRIEGQLGLEGLITAARSAVIAGDPKLILPLEKWYGAPKYLRELAAKMLAGAR